MKVLILTHFSRGDIQPFAALAKSLSEQGHEVTVGAPETSAHLFHANAQRVLRFQDRTKKIVNDPHIRGLSRKNVPLQLIPRVQRERAGMLDDFASAADEKPDIVIHSAALPGHQIAELLGVPAVPVCAHPSWVPTTSFANPFFPYALPSSLNRSSYAWTGLVMRTLFPTVGRWRRRTLGLPPRRGHRNVMLRPDGTPTVALQAFSRHVLPSPLRYPKWVHTTGYWLLPTAPDRREAPTALSAFLEAGDPPICIGFGSMALTEPRRLGRTVAEAVRLADVRAVVVGGWGAIDPHELPDEIAYVQETSFDWLFPRVAAIVHHGGNGTIGYALAAGRPQVVCPFSTTDQAFYARQLHSCGVAPPPQPYRDLTPERLARAIHQAVTDGRLARRAHELGDRIRAEDGPTKAVKILETVP
ncbi:glycosyltransferase [Phytoactinopolyspora limicola]|uniref:glycosyltransferase n=1 Tax=Phytoactinopolyspora limicola TaxID=2715536 RepID=UPI00140B900F